MSLFAGPLGKLAKAALTLGTVGWGVQASLFNVEPGHRAVLYDHYFGVKEKVWGEGTHFLVPVLQYPIFVDVRTRPRTVNTVAKSKDLQAVNVTLRILSRPYEEAIRDVFLKYGPDFDERLLPSFGNEVLKAVIAEHNAESLLTERELVSTEIRDRLTARARDFNLILDDVALTHLTFSRDFARAIEHKEVAYQQAETAKFLVQKAEQEKRARVIRSEGDAEAAQLLSDAMEKHGTGLVEVRRIETALDVAETLARSRNVTYLPSTGNLLMNLQA